MSTTVKIPGTELVLGGQKYVVPPLSLGTIEVMTDRLQSFGKNGMKDMTTAIDATHAALLRNYPDLSREQVADLLDLGNVAEVMSVVMARAGLTAKADDTGEAGAVKR